MRSSTLQYLLPLIACALFTNTRAAAQFPGDLEYLECGSLITFEKTNAFTIEDVTGNGLSWTNIATCGQSGNFTGGSGDALCVTAGTGLSPFEATVDTNAFSLRGVTSAQVKFKLNYQDYITIVGANDRLEVQARSDYGSWSNVAAYITDIGTFEGSGQEISLSLNAWLDKSDVQVRFRYYDSSSGPDSGAYVQIDDISIECIGGADMASSLSHDASGAVMEGDTVNFTFTARNDGPQTATEPGLVANLPSGFFLISYTPSALNIGPIQEFSENSAAFQSATPLNPMDAFGVDVQAIAGVFPEIAFEVTSPSALAGVYEAGGAMFGPDFPMNSPFTGQLLLADDGTGNANDGCEPLLNAASVSGKVVLLDRSSNCKSDEKILNAQKAGASAAIVFDADSLAITEALFNKDLTVISSGDVTEPITIPTVQVRRESGELFKANIASGIELSIQRVDVLSQEQSFFSFATAEQVDPDFSLSKIFLQQTLVTNNIASSTITVLKDSDNDGTPDINDACRFDPAKVTPGDCGCHNTDTDENFNTIPDCFQVKETLFLLEELSIAVKKLRPIAQGTSKKKKKIARKRRKAAKSSLAAFQNYYLISANELVATSTNSNINIEKLQKRLGKSVRKSLKIQSGAFRKNKKKATRGIRKFLGLF